MLPVSYRLLWYASWYAPFEWSCLLQQLHPPWWCHKSVKHRVTGHYVNVQRAPKTPLQLQPVKALGYKTHTKHWLWQRCSEMGRKQYYILGVQNWQQTRKKLSAGYLLYLEGSLTQQCDKHFRGMRRGRSPQSPKTTLMKRWAKNSPSPKPQSLRFLFREKIVNPNKRKQQRGGKL